jgi:hypothetical protein
LLIVLLDTSALGALTAPEAFQIRHRLLEKVRGGGLILLVTDPLGWEMAAARAVNDTKYRAMVDLLARLTNGRVLLSAPDRREREAKLGRALTFDEVVRAAQRFVQIFDVRVVDEEAARRGGMLRGLRFREAEKASDTVEALDAEVRKQRLTQSAIASTSDERSVWHDGLKKQFRNPAYVGQLVADYARTDLDGIGELYRLNTSGLDPLSLPTFASVAAIHVARVRSVIVGGTSPTGRRSANQADLLHLEEAASYADVFVTCDGRLKAFAETVSSLRCRVATFNEWSKELLE